MDISKLTHGAKLVLGGTIAVPDRLDLQLAGVDTGTSLSA